MSDTPVLPIIEPCAMEPIDIPPIAPKTLYAVIGLWRGRWKVRCDSEGDEGWARDEARGMVDSHQWSNVAIVHIRAEAK